MKVYVAGKITGLDRFEVTEKFLRARAMWEDAGHAVFVPTVLPVYEDDVVPHSDYLHICKAMIEVCDTVYFLSNWKESTGAKEEMEYAREKGKQIIIEAGGEE